MSEEIEYTGTNLMPAIPPEDYTGSILDWSEALQDRGLWDGEGWHGDIEITSVIWREILEECEQETD